MKVKDADYQLKADQAIITAGNASDLAVMLSLNQRDLVIDLQDWFSLGIVNWKGQRLFDQGKLESKQHDFKLNKKTRFESRLVALDDFEERIETVVEKSLKGFEGHAGDRIAEVEEIVNQRKEAIVGQVRAHCLPYGKRQQGEDAAGRQSSVILKASPFELRRILESDLQELTSQERSVDTLSQLWLIENMAKGFGLRTAVNKKGEHLLAKPSQIPKMGKATQFADELAGALKEERKAEPGVEKASVAEERAEIIERLKALGWDGLLAQAEEMRLGVGAENVKAIFPRELKGSALEGFEKGLLEFFGEFREFLQKASKAVVTADNQDDYDSTVALSAFIFRSQILARLRPVETKRSKGKLKNYWNGIQVGGQALVKLREMELKKAQLLIDESVYYSRGKTLELTRVPKVYTGDGRDEDEMGLLVLELLEGMYGRE